MKFRTALALVALANILTANNDYKPQTQNFAFLASKKKNKFLNTK